jgi:hypothetical protein
MKLVGIRSSSSKAVSRVTVTVLVFAGLKL